MDVEKIYKVYGWKPDMGDYKFPQEEHISHSKFNLKKIFNKKSLLTLTLVLTGVVLFFIFKS